MSTLVIKSETADIAPRGKGGTPVVDNSSFANLLDTAKFDHLWRVAKMFSESKLVPAHFQGDGPSCFVACQMSLRLDVDPLMFMQNCYVVGNKPGMEAKFAIGLVNTSGMFEGPLQWRMSGEGKSRAATCFAVSSRNGDMCECTVSMAIAEAEGWLSKSGSKWRTMPEQMLRYRSAAWFARLYCPERLLGMRTADELEDIEQPRRVVTNTAPGSAGLLERLREGDEPAGSTSDADTSSPAEPTEAAETPTVRQVIDAVVLRKSGCPDAGLRAVAIDQWAAKSEIGPESLAAPSDGNAEATAIIDSAEKCRLWATYLRD